MITNFFQNQDILTNYEYFKILIDFYNFQLEDEDYIDILKIITWKKYDNVTNIKTNFIYCDIKRELHGRNFSFWTIKYRLYIKAATMQNIIDVNREYNIEELKKLICDNKIYPLRKISIMCDNKENKYE